MQLIPSLTSELCMQAEVRRSISRSVPARSAIMTVLESRPMRPTTGSRESSIVPTCPDLRKSHLYLLLDRISTSTFPLESPLSNVLTVGIRNALGTAPACIVAEFTAAIMFRSNTYPHEHIT